ncbi:DUF6603 domain-containing protein [Streptomyces sp. NPDC087263]|uniref:DUF6603 domain-containing protein n=1 Tax=Streptomyces sp. NPDC087263 TaxID=3365773 RepID=UPI003815353F
MTASRAGTVELVACEIATALQPLEQHLSADRRIEFFQDLGLWLPGGLDDAAGAIGTVAVQAAGLSPIILRLSAAIQGGQPGPIIQEGGALLGALKEVLTAITELRPALDTAVANASALTDAQRTRLRAEMEQLPKRLLDYVLITYLEGKSTGVVEALTMVGIIEDLPAFFDPNDFTVLPVRRKVLHLDRLLTLFTDPAELLSEVFDFGSTAFDGMKLFRLLADQFLKHDQNYFYKGPPDTPDTPPTLDMYLARMTADTSVSPPGLTAELHVMEGETISRRTELSPLWTLLLDASATVTSEATAHLAPPLNITLQSAAALALNVSLGLEAKHADETPVLLLGQAGASRLEFQRFAVTLGLAATANAGGSVTAEPSAQLALEGGHLLIDLSSGDGFIATITGGGKIESDFALRALWAPSAGLRLEGSGSLDLAIPVHLELGPVEITTLYISAGIGSGGALPLEISGAFTAELGPITASVDRVGLIVSARFRDGGNLGPLDLDFAFKPPDGVGLAVDAGVISGGGYLKVDSDRGEYAGALELEFAGFLSLKAIGLISTRMPDGSDGFSLLIIITAEFGGGGIQLGYGFTLLAVGGLIGLNRSMNLRMLTEGVRTGRIESVMFPQDVVANAPRIISDLQLFFPPEQGKFLIGPMAKIGWGTPTLISVSLGVIIEIPGNLAVLGVLKCILPTKELPLVVIQVAFIGAIEFDKSRLWFYAQLFDSRILTMSIDGGMGLLVAWGDNPDLVLTVGGFHPSFTPPALPFPMPPRLSIDIIHTSVALIRVSGYFAVTSNTAQFGAAAELRLGFSDFGIEGHLSFDALFRFSPFAFVIGISASVSLKAFGVGLFGIDLRFQLEGPSPWRAQGRGSISLLFFEISADFDIGWGEDHNTTLPPVEVLPLLAAEVAKTEGWQTRLPTGGTNPLVNLRPLPDTDQLVLHPLGTLFVRQRSIPLGVRVDRVGSQKPSDGKRFTIAPDPDSGLVQLSVPDEKFAMAQFQDMDDAAKLSKPAYEDQDAGLELSAQLEALSSPRVVRRSARYETHVFDSRTKAAAAPGTSATAAAAPVGAGTSSTPKRFQNVSSAVFNQFLSGSSTSRSPLSQQEARRKQHFAAEDTVQVTAQRFVVAYVRNNLQALPPTAGVARGATTFRSQTTAADALDEWVAADPSLAGKLHVIREAEVAAPLTAPGTWTAANPAPFEAADTGAVRLAGGAVLIAGGRGPTGEALAAVAVFDPVRGTWTAAPELGSARHGHAVTLLADGRVLVTGGRGADGAPLDSAELYDPVAGAWTAVAEPMATARHRHSATQLGNGLVLVAGGAATRSADSERSLSTAELFDPRTGAWVTDPAKQPPPMTEARAGHRAVLLPDSGRVLVTGGALATGGGETALAYCELYEPDANAWTPAASLATPRRGHQATVLADGSVLVTGGEATATGAAGRFDPAALAAAESYHPGADSWTRAAAPAGGRTGHRAVPLRTGRVLLLGGATGPAGTTGYRSATVYDPDTRAWTGVGGLGTGRRDFAAVELADGRVLAVGGVVRSGAAAPGGIDVLTTTTEIFTP